MQFFANRKAIAGMMCVEQAVCQPESSMKTAVFTPRHVGRNCRVGNLGRVIWSLSVFHDPV